MGDKNSQMAEFVTAVGAIAESSALLYKELTQNGVPPNHACQMTSAYIRGIVAQSKGGECDE